MRQTIPSAMLAICMLAATTAVPAGERVRPGADRAGARMVALQSATLRVDFDTSSGCFEILDLRNGGKWPMAPPGEAPANVADVRVGGGRRGLTAKLQTAAGAAELSLEIQEPAELLVRLKPAQPGRWAEVAYPSPLRPPSRQAELVLPTDEGAILPAAGVGIPRLLGDYTYHQFGYLMPWFGFVEGERGVMAMAETPDDLSIRVGKAGQPNPLLTAGVVWLPSRNGLRYERRLRFCVLDRGGYVAMAKRYRKWLVDRGRFRTLADKAKELPAVGKLIGAVDVYDHSPGDEVLNWMITNGIRRALYSGPRRKANNEKALAAGYLTARYNNYASIATPELLAAWNAKPNPGHHFLCACMDEVFVRRDGSPQPGFAIPFGATGGVVAPDRLKTVRDAYRCSAAKLAWLRKTLPNEAEEQALAALFLDVETASPPTECYSKKHPLTRTDDIRERTRLFDYLRSIGQLAGSEGGADWAAPALHYQEGSLTLNRLNYLKGIYVGTAPFDLPDEYIAAQFDMARRAPLHKLVYHDSVLMTWRWNHTPNRWARGAEYWDDWDLLHILYGGMPIFVVDKPNIERKGDRILQSCRNIGGVLEKTGGSEMLSHRFVTVDRQVQETRFDNGWAVRVNFGKAGAYSGEGHRLGPKSFEAYRWR